MKPFILPLVMVSVLAGAATATPLTPGKESNGEPDSLAASDWAGIREAYEAGRHAVRPAENEWLASNPGQGWMIRFDGLGFRVQPRLKDWEWGMELRSYGFEGSEMKTDTVPTVQTAGQRLTYGWDSNVEEWFVNDQRGLEHGFTVRERPTGSVGGPLRFVLGIRGGLQPRLHSDGLGADFLDPSGATALTYAGLKVWDADGKILPARFSARPGGLRLEVEETGARYPVTIDPVAQQAYFKSAGNGPLTSEKLGGAVALSGDTAVIGVVSENGSATGVNGVVDELASGAGAAFVFVRTGATWTQQAYLKASQVSGGDQFGISVAISGDTIVVGASGEDGSATGVNGPADEAANAAGAAYVFVRSGTTWSQQAYLKASQPTATDQFGFAVAVSGDTIVVGSAFEDGNSTGVNGPVNELSSASGAAFVFVRNGTTWSQQAYLKASQVTSNDQFGKAVAVSGDTVVVGSYQENTSGAGINPVADETSNDSGAAYVFVRDGTAWSQQAFLKAAQVTAGDWFGWSVAVSGNTIVVGSREEDGSATGVNGVVDDVLGQFANPGAAYVFVRDGETWTQQAYLKASQISLNDRFGQSVAISGDTVVVGAFEEDGNTPGVNGAINEAAVDSGAAYVFVRSGNAWSLEAYLKSSQVTGVDQFGYSVAVSGTTVLVGAPQEDGRSAVINGVHDETLGPNGDTGAAYVFVLNGATWGQQAYVKSTSTPQGPNGGFDRFGTSVAISGNTVVVGAPNEDGSATGVNGFADETVSGSGAAIVFVRKGTTWTQQAYLKASQVSPEDLFGTSVAISGDTVVVGAKFEDGSSSGVNGTVNEAANESGAAYVFVRNGTIWSQQAYLKAAQVTVGDQFGISVGISADTVVVGANLEDGGATGVDGTVTEDINNSGAAYVFVRDGAVWSQQAYLKAAQVTAADEFGISVGISDNSIVVGAHQEDGSSTGVNGPVNESANIAGAAYVFVRDGSTWSQQAYLKAGQISNLDQFGISVAISGDTVVVGADGEDGSTPGVNGIINEGSSGSGAAYVFLRSGTAWGQQAYLKASQISSGDRFGNSVAASGDVVVVGAISEDGSSPGIDGPANEAATSAGAAYAFVRNGTTWSQQAYLKAHQVSAFDNFGTSVAVSGATVMVGAPAEDGSASGMNGALDEAAADSGAAYGFILTGIYEAWSTAYGVSSDPGVLNGANLLAFAFDCDPGTGIGELNYGGTFAGGGDLNRTGGPATRFEGNDFRTLFVRRKDHVAAGLAYIPQFSVDLSSWENGLVAPTVLADDGTNQIVSVSHPLISGIRARFCRIKLDITP